MPVPACRQIATKNDVISSTPSSHTTRLKDFVAGPPYTSRPMDSALCRNMSQPKSSKLHRNFIEASPRVSRLSYYLERRSQAQRTTHVTPQAACRMFHPIGGSDGRAPRHPVPCPAHPGTAGTADTLQPPKAKAQAPPALMSTAEVSTSDPPQRKRTRVRRRLSTATMLWYAMVAL